MSSTPARSGQVPELRGFQRLWRVLRQLFYEAVGALFAVLAVGWLNSAFRAWTKDVARWLIGVSIGVAGLFIFFAVSSFRRAKQL